MTPSREVRQPFPKHLREARGHAATPQHGYLRILRTLSACACLVIGTIAMISSGLVPGITVPYIIYLDVRTWRTMQGPAMDRFPALPGTGSRSPYVPHANSGMGTRAPRSRTPVRYESGGKVSVSTVMVRSRDGQPSAALTFVDANPVLIRQVMPEYTAAAAEAGVSGKVALLAIIDEEGMPRGLRVSKGLGYGLDEAVLAAVEQWRFRPAVRQGKPLPVRATIEVGFDKDEGAGDGPELAVEPKP